MKALLLTTVLVIVTILSCRKNDVTNTSDKLAVNATCKKTMASIAGKYRLTKVEQVSYPSGEAKDVTDSTDGCILAGIFKLFANGRAIYTEPSNCNGSGTGSWSISNGSVYTSFSS